MTTFIEEIQENIKNEIDVISDDIEIIWKRKFAYIRFYFSEGTVSQTTKFNKNSVKKYLTGQQGSAHSVMRISHFFEAFAA